jgi:hypothetical protein
MTNNQIQEAPAITSDGVSEQHLDEEDFETLAQYHRMAAHHFSAAAKHHLSAAAADEEGDDESVARHAYMAYRHQLSGLQYAEIAAMDNDGLEDEYEQQSAAD